MKQINVNCLRRINTVVANANDNYPITLQAFNKKGVHFSDVTMQADGTVFCKANNTRYLHFSHLRAQLIEPNGPTYTRFMYKGKTLREWGVRR